jgi:hypothetical protein
MNFKERLYRICVVVLALGVFLLPMALYGPHDQEEWGGSVWSTLQYSLAIWDARMPPMWSDSLGLGTPMPLGHRFDFSPPFLLFPLLSIRWVIFLFYAFYLSIALLYLWKICDEYKFSPNLNVVICISFLFSAPTVQLMYLDDWPTLFHTWCFLPIIFFYLRRLIYSSAWASSWKNITILGVVVGIWAINGHSGHMFTLASILAIYSFYLILPRKELLLKLLVSCIISALISSEHIYHLVSESLLFPPDVHRSMAQDGISVLDFINTFTRPLDLLGFVDLLEKNEFRLGFLWSAFLTNLNLRTPFVGALILFSALFFSHRSLLANNIVDREHVAISFTFLISFFLMFMKASYLNNLPSGTWMYRDGVVFFGLISAGLWMKSKLNYKSNLSKWLQKLLFIHFLQLLFSFYPVIHNSIVKPGLYNYQNFGILNGLPGWISTSIDKPNPRLFFVNNESGTESRIKFVKDGLYGVTDLTFFGVRPFTAWIKSVSMDLIARSVSLGHGLIPGYKDILINGQMLNVFGVNLIFMSSDVYESLSSSHVNKNFILIGSYLTSSGTVHLLRNKDAWPEAFLMSMDVINLQTIKRVCNYQGAICGDYTEWPKFLLEDEVRVYGRDGDYSYQIEPSLNTRLFVTSKLYRPEWEARSGPLQLQVIKVGEALTGVVVPNNVSSFTLTYVSTIRLFLRWVGLFSLVISVFFIIFSPFTKHTKK